MLVSRKQCALRFDSINLHLGTAWSILCLVIDICGASCTGNILSCSKVQAFGIYMTLTPGPGCFTDCLNMNGGSCSVGHTRSAANTTEKSAQLNASGIPGKILSVQIFCIKPYFVFQCKQILKFLLYEEQDHLCSL